MPMPGAFYLIGDLPIYVAPCSADVWAAPGVVYALSLRRASRLAGVSAGRVRPPASCGQPGYITGAPRAYRVPLVGGTAAARFALV